MKRRTHLQVLSAPSRLKSFTAPWCLPRVLAKWRHSARGGIPDTIENILKQDREDGLPAGIQFGIVSRASDALRWVRSALAGGTHRFAAEKIAVTCNLH